MQLIDTLAFTKSLNDFCFLNLYEFEKFQFMKKCRSRNKTTKPQVAVFSTKY